MFNFNLKIAYLNINRLFNKLHYAEYLLKSQNIDIFFIAETWLTNIIGDSFLNISDYLLLRYDRDYSLGGGLICYYKNTLNVEEIYNYCSFNIEYCILKVNNILPLYLYIKKPNASIVFIDELDSALLRYGNKNTVILGDFNIDWFKQKKLHYGKII